ncbi:MAG: hypothetical protein CO141_04045 [Candidatus Moranbacteria bacterium CG_4_9_14_3_um_filter_42_9]|nr:MAG: hypothetical protein CO141_04045 [Candidatus Moranbacteria bacterium CG_4_9_14_3_um_filter_42_9]
MANVKLNFLHVCENAFTSSDGKLNIIGIFNQINATNLPALHPRLMIVTSLAGEVKGYMESIEIISPKGQVIAKAGNPIEIFKEDGSANFIADFVGIVFPDEGKYKITVKVDENIINADNNDSFILIKRNGKR